MTFYDGEVMVATLRVLRDYVVLHFRDGTGTYWLKDVHAAMSHMSCRYGDVRIAD